MKNFIPTREYDRGWTNLFNSGATDYGDLNLSIVFLEKINLLKKNHSILEIGSGNGKLCDFLDKKGFSHVIGVDIAFSALNHAKKNYPNLNFLKMDATNLAFKNNSFDICISFDLVEHTDNIDTHFKNVINKLKTDGKYIFQTPNKLTNTIFETIRNKNLLWKKYHPSLQFSFTLKKKLKLAGFRKIEFIKISPTSKHKLSKLPSILRPIFKSIPWLWVPLFFQTNFYVIAYK